MPGEIHPEATLDGVITNAETGLDSLASAHTSLESAKTGLEYSVAGSYQPEAEQAILQFNEAFPKIDEARQLVQNAVEKVRQIAGAISTSSEATVSASAGPASLGTGPVTERLRPKEVFVSETHVTAGDIVQPVTHPSENVLSEASKLIRVSDAAEILNIPPDSVSFINNQLLRIIIGGTVSYYPAQYVEELAASAYWRNRVEHTPAVASFAQTKTAADVAHQSQGAFEGRIDASLTRLGNAAMMAGQVAELLGVDSHTVSRWKRDGTIDPEALLKGGRRADIPPHVLFGMYRWEYPASYPKEQQDDSDDPLLTRSEASEILGISTSGFEKTEAYLHSVDLASGAKRLFASSYVRSLAGSPQKSETNSPTAAARAFSHQAAAARAMAKAESALSKRAASLVIPQFGGAMLAREALGNLFGMSRRTIEIWQDRGLLPRRPSGQQRKDLLLSQAQLKQTYKWRYPQGYPQNS